MTMIQANELRIGNWINNHREPEQVNLWHLQVADKNEYFSPIPLTPDRLEKCGFVKNKLGEMSIEVTDPSFHLELMEGKENYFYPSITQTPDMDEERTVWLNRINSLHQLQNLYFALTGEELTYKPTT